MRNFLLKKQYKDSLQSAINWSKYQPLSSNPVIMASYISSVCLDDQLEAIRILKNSYLLLIRFSD